MAGIVSDYIFIRESKLRFKVLKFLCWLVAWMGIADRSVRHFFVPSVPSLVIITVSTTVKDEAMKSHNLI